MKNKNLTPLSLIVGIGCTVGAITVFFTNRQGSGLASLIYVLLGVLGACATFLGMPKLINRGKILQILLAIVGFVFLIIGFYIGLVADGVGIPSGRNAVVAIFPALAGIFLMIPLFPEKKRRRKKK